MVDGGEPGVYSRDEGKHTVSTVYTVLEGTCYRYSYIVLRREDDVYCIVADRDEERVLRGG